MPDGSVTPGSSLFHFCLRRDSNLDAPCLATRRTLLLNWLRRCYPDLGSKKFVDSSSNRPWYPACHRCWVPILTSQSLDCFHRKLTRLEQLLILVWTRSVSDRVQGWTGDRCHLPWPLVPSIFSPCGLILQNHPRIRLTPSLGLRRCPPLVHFLCRSWDNQNDYCLSLALLLSLRAAYSVGLQTSRSAFSDQQLKAVSECRGFALLVLLFLLVWRH